MKKFFLLFLIAALIVVAMIFVACNDQPGELPAVDNPASEIYHEHPLNDPVVVKPTCSAGGYTEYTCTDPSCKYVYRDTFTAVEPDQHNYPNKGKYTEKEAATCQKTGLENRTCTICGHVDEREIAKKSHNYKISISRVEPDCENGGYEIKKCEWCNETKRTEIPKKGHSYTAWEVLVPNINEQGECVIGTEIRKCKVCSHEETRELPAHHGAAMAVVEPTCTKAGYTIYKCDACDLTYYADFKNPTDNHELCDWKDYVGYPGYEARYCDNCEYAEYREKESK